MDARVEDVVRVVPKPDRRANANEHAALVALALQRRWERESRREDALVARPAAVVWLALGGSIGLIVLAFIAALG